MAGGTSKRIWNLATLRGSRLPPGIGIDACDFHRRLPASPPTSRKPPAALNTSLLRICLSFIRGETRFLIQHCLGNIPEMCKKTPLPAGLVIERYFQALIARWQQALPRAVFDGRSCRT